jgi:hypothetical protein
VFEKEAVVRQSLLYHSSHYFGVHSFIWDCVFGPSVKLECCLRRNGRAERMLVGDDFDGIVHCHNGRAKSMTHIFFPIVRSGKKCASFEGTEAIFFAVVCRTFRADPFTSDGVFCFPRPFFPSRDPRHGCLVYYKRRDKRRPTLSQPVPQAPAFEHLSFSFASHI